MTTFRVFHPLDTPTPFNALFRRSLLRNSLLGEYCLPPSLGAHPGDPECGALPILVDIREDKTAYILHAELPGVKKDDIHVEIDGDRLTIDAEIRQEKGSSEASLLRSERYYGRLTRNFQLLHPVDGQAIQAKYENGVLELLLPKKAAAASTRIAVQ